MYFAKGIDILAQEIKPIHSVDLNLLAIDLNLAQQIKTWQINIGLKY